MRVKRVVLRFIVILCCFLLEFSAPNFAAGDSNKASQTPAPDKPKKEDNSKPTPIATEVAPSTAARPVESKATESKPTAEAKPSESKASSEAKPSENKASSEAINSKEPKPENSNKADSGADAKKNTKPEVKETSKPESKSTKKSASQSSKSNSGENGKGNAKEGNAKEEKTTGAEKSTKKVKSNSAPPSPSPSQRESSVRPSTTSTTSATATPSSEPSAERFVRIEKSKGNKATLIVSGPKIGSRIKIIITSKGSKK